MAPILTELILIMAEILTEAIPKAETGGSSASGGGSTGGVGNFTIDNSANITDAQRKIAEQAAKDEGNAEWSWSNATNNGVEGCAASVSAVLNGAGVLKHKMTAINASDSNGDEVAQLEANGFVQLKPGEKPQPGDIWIGRGGPSSGHTGIIGPNGVEYDNHSGTGKWTRETSNYFAQWTHNTFYRKVK